MGIISTGDFIDLFYKIKTRGAAFILGKISPSPETRTINTWNDINVISSNWWIIEPIRKRWNKLITGSEETEYENYFSSKYLWDKNDISVLSVGCGNGEHEIKFAGFKNIKKVVGIDIANNPITTAIDKASKLDLQKLSFQNISFEKFSTEEKFDVILFHSSLHHFKDIKGILLKVNELLAHKGFVIINEYVGPSKFQFGNERKTLLNAVLNSIPSNLKRRQGTKKIKTKIYEPGILRMYIADPSEAANSSAIMLNLNLQFAVLEEKKTGGDILHFMLKDIAHNFLNENKETSAVLQNLFMIEDEYIANKKNSDFMFGIYQKKE